MITSSLLTPEDVEAERDVILDEIAMHDDDPDDVVHNLFAEQAYGANAPLGRPIAGTVDSIEALTRAQVARFYQRHYRPGEHGRRRGRQPRPRRGRAAWCGRRSAAAAG